ncbi:MAG: hypothetical protein KAU02_00355 [Tenericutes bacterium]|nr:hypothetical protein [Mycoplasmatota bacterium]
MLTALAKLQDNEITPEKAYNEIYKKRKRKKVPFFRRASFIKLNIRVPDQKGVNRFLRVLFFMPFPIVIMRIILSFVRLDKYSDDIPFTKSELIGIIQHRGIKIEVDSHSGEKILIKTI